MVNPCCYGGPLCMMSVRDISFSSCSPVMLFIWLTICNKKELHETSVQFLYHQLYITLSSKRYLPPLTTTLFCGTASATSFAIHILCICRLVHYPDLCGLCIVMNCSYLYRNTAVTSVTNIPMIKNFPIICPHIISAFVTYVMFLILRLIICSLYHLCLIMALFLVLNCIGHILYPCMGMSSWLIRCA